MNRCFEALEKKFRDCTTVVAVLGQPNVGKSTLFNRITGSTERVGNFPGTTVEIKVGSVRYEGERICFVDLPGVYGLSATTTEEKIARSFVLGGRADVYLVIADSTLPERTLYLAIQLLEMSPNVVIAFTKWDLAHKKGVHIHIDKIESRLGVPVVPVSGVTGEGITQLLDTILRIARRKHVRAEPLRIDYGVLESYIKELENVLKDVDLGELERVPRRWLALRLLEGDEEIADMLRSRGLENVVQIAMRMRDEISRIVGRKPEDIAIENRFRFVENILRDTVVRIEVGEEKLSLIDKAMRNPVVGTALSISILFAMFVAVFAINTGFPLNIVFHLLGLEAAAQAIESYSLGGLLESLFDTLADAVRSHLENLNPVVASLVADGIIGGVGAVLSFFPLVLLIAIAIAILEDSGIGPRMATALHGLFTRFGLSGRAVYPLLIAFGCNVPAVLASRAAIDDVERREIVSTVSFIPCQARLVVILYFVTHIVGNPMLQASTVLALYIGGVLLYMLSSKLLRAVVFRVREAPELLLEIPPIHRPSLRVVWWNSWDTAKHFLKKAGTIIFALSVVSWALLSFGPSGYVESVQDSYAAIIGKIFAPALQILYDLHPDTAWKIGFALVCGFIAKEGLVASIAQMSGVSEESAIEVLGISTAQGIAILVFMVYYIPCLATIAAIYQELRSIRMTALAVLYTVVLALVLSIIIYSILSILI